MPGSVKDFDEVTPTKPGSKMARLWELLTHHSSDLTKRMNDLEQDIRQLQNRVSHLELDAAKGVTK